MRYLLLVLSFFLFTACSDDGEKTDKYDFPTIAIDGDNIADTVNKSGIYDLKVIGNDNTVTINNHNDIRRLEIKGSRNTFIFEGPMGDLDGELVYGIDNLVCVPTENDKFFFDVDTDPNICYLEENDPNDDEDNEVVCDPNRSSNKVIVINSVEECIHPDDAPSS